MKEFAAVSKDVPKALIGAAGVAAMGMEKIDFIWYLKKITWLAFAGFMAGALTFLFIEHFIR